MSQFFSKLVVPQSEGGLAGRDPLIAPSGESIVERDTGRGYVINGPRLGQTLAAIVLLISLSSAPYIELPRILNQPLNTTSWTYIYPYWGVAILSCLAASRWIDRNGMSVGLRRRLLPTVALAAIIVLSPIWAEAAFSLPLDSLLVALLMGAGVWFGIALDPRQWAVAIFVSSQALVLGSLVEIWLRPRYGVSPYGDWMGVFGNRNTLAPIAGLGVLGSFGLWVVYRRRWLVVVGVASAFLDLYVLHRSGNATTWLSLAAAFGLVLTLILLSVLMRSDRSAPRFGPRAKGLAVAGMVAVGLAGIVAILFKANRSSSFDDRRHLWSYLWNVSAHHRLLGYGFGSFWRDDAKVAPISTPDFRWDAAHNSFVEIYIGVGLVGLAIVGSLVLMGTWYLYADIRTKRTLAAVFPAMIFCFVVMENLSESMILYNSSVWMLLIAGAFFGNRQLDPMVNEFNVVRRP